VLRGGGPPDVVELTVRLAREMLALVGLGRPHGPDPAEVLASGAAEPVWRAMIAAQGGDPDDGPARGPDRRAAARRAGRGARRLDAYPVGVAALAARCRAGAQGGRGGRGGRDPAAGRIGEPVVAGQPLLELHTDRPDSLPAARAALAGGPRLAPEGAPTPGRPPLVLAALGSATPAVTGPATAARAAAPGRRDRLLARPPRDAATGHSRSAPGSRRTGR